MVSIKHFAKKLQSHMLEKDAGKIWKLNVESQYIHGVVLRTYSTPQVSPSLDGRSQFKFDGVYLV